MASRATKKKPTTARKATRKTAAKKRPAASKRAPAMNPAIKQQSAELYQLPFNAEQFDEAARQASDQLRSATESVMQTSNEMMQQIFAATGQAVNQAPSPKAAAPDVSEIASRAIDYSRDSFEQFSQMAGISSSSAQESAEMLRENIDAFMTSVNIFAQIAKQLAAHSVAFSNRSFNQQVELSKQALTCRTLNDWFDLSSAYAKSTTENFFSEMLAVSEMLFQGATEISDPIQTSVNESAQRARKIMEA